MTSFSPPTIVLSSVSSSPTRETTGSPTSSRTEHPSGSPAPTSAPTLVETLEITQTFDLKRKLKHDERRMFEDLLANYSYAPGNGIPVRVDTSCEFIRQRRVDTKEGDRIKILYDMTWTSQNMHESTGFRCAFLDFINKDPGLSQLVSDLKNAGLSFVSSAKEATDSYDDSIECLAPPSLPPTVLPTTKAPTHLPSASPSDYHTLMPTGHPTYLPTDHPTYLPTTSPSLLKLPSVSVAAYWQDFQITEARTLNETEQVIFENVIAKYTPSYGPSKSTAFGKVNTSCEIRTQTILENARMLRANMGRTPFFAQSHRGTQDVPSRLRIVYNITWMSVYMNVSEYSNAFATHVNGSLTQLIVDMQNAGLTAVKKAHPVFPAGSETVKNCKLCNEELAGTADNAGNAVGIAFAAISVLLILIFACWVASRSRRQKRRNDPQPHARLSEEVEPMNIGAEVELEKETSGKEGSFEPSNDSSADVDKTIDISADAEECNHLHDNLSIALDVATISPSSVLMSNPTEETDTSVRNGGQAVSNVVTSDAPSPGKHGPGLEGPLTPPGTKEGHSRRGGHRSVQSMPEGGFSSILSFFPEALSAAAALVAPDVENGGREVMREVINSPESDPLPISIQYLKHCTDKFSETRWLGEGSFSQVYLGKDAELRRKFAVKRFRLKPLAVDIDPEKAEKMVERELKTLKTFRHPNIARLYAYHFSPNLFGRHCLVFELASRGSLCGILKDRAQREQLHWTTRISIAFDVAKALEYLHKGRAGQICYHRDVKSSNICLKRDFTALLIDCGVSKMIPDDDSNATITFMESIPGVMGSPGYICPVFARRMRGYESANDVFSLGVVFTEIFTGVLQGSKVDGQEIDIFNRYSADGIEKRELEKDADGCAGDWNSRARNRFAQLAVECISHDTGKRPKMEDIVQRLGNLAGIARPSSLGERNRITVLFSGPLAFRDASSEELHPLDSLNFQRERDLLTRCMAEAGRCIELNFDVATDDRLHAAVTKRCGCLHFSGHGHPSFLVFEDGSGGAHVMGEEKLYDCVHAEPFNFVFVSACHSLFMGRALVKARVPHVVCCKQDMELRDSAAIKFTHSFYFALAEGYTIKAAFDKGKMAVSKRFDQSEVDRFLLLPEDGDHERSLFLDAEKLEWSDETTTEQPIPLPPQFFLGRELAMYNLLQLILSQQLVALVGSEGVGCSSLASATCHYISERKTTMLDIEAIYFVRSKTEIQSSSNNLMSFIKPLHGRLVSEARANVLRDGADNGSYFRSIIDALAGGKKSLVVFDGADTKDAALFDFVTSLFQATNTVKLLLTAREAMNYPSCPVDESVFALGPLSRESTVSLFTKVWQQKGMATQSCEILKSKLASSDLIFDKIGGGFPAQTIRTAKSMSKQQLDDLLAGA